MEKCNKDYSVNYNTPEERELICKIHQLMMDWESSSGDELFVQDGFYPYYLNQKIKILFIGREAIDLAKHNYIEALFIAFKNNRIGGRHINQCAFQRRLFYLAFGILNDFPDWREAVPHPSKLTEDFATEKGISFAFMNISKTSNDTQSWKSCSKRIQESIEKATVGRNFIKEEISLLNPDLIISCNIDITSILNETNKLNNSPEVDCYLYHTGEKEIPLFNTYHFSAIGKSDKEHFYEPMKAAFNKFYKKDI